MATMKKRQADNLEVNIVRDKRARFDLNEDSVDSNDPSGKEIALESKRHSLKGSTMLLTGHDAEIFTVKFHPSGVIFASAGADRSIYLWYAQGDCENFAILRAAHSGTILDLTYSADGDRLVSCSVDKTVIIWDTNTGCRLKKLRNHYSHINAISASTTDPNLVTTVGDDCYVNIWDLRNRKCAMSFEDDYQLMSVAIGPTNDQIFVGGIDNSVHCWDIKRAGKHYSMLGHSDTITGLNVSPDGYHLLSNSMDNTLKSWDIRPYAPQNRLEKTFRGHQHNFEMNLLRCSWSPKGNLISAGSSDKIVYIWNYNNCDIVSKLPGHKGSVNEVVFSPRDPLILSCGNDKQMYIGEINQEIL